MTRSAPPTVAHSILRTPEIAGLERLFEGVAGLDVRGLDGIFHGFVPRLAFAQSPRERRRSCRPEALWRPAGRHRSTRRRPTADSCRPRPQPVTRRERWCPCETGPPRRYIGQFSRVRRPSRRTQVFHDQLELPIEPLREVHERIADAPKSVIVRAVRVLKDERQRQR